MMIRWVFVFITYAALSYASSPPTFKERIARAKNGDYFVIEANKIVTLLAVRAATPQTLLIEEISAPVRNFKDLSNPEPGFWTHWVKQRAPGHTSWAMLEIDLKTGQVIEGYSFSRASWIQVSPEESLFSTLLQLPLETTPSGDRRKIGPPPLEGEADRRPLWEPQLVYEGKKREGAVFDVFKANWPNDGSELSGKTVLLYFDRNLRLPFPFWIQIEAAYASAQIRTIDSGRNFISHHRTFPRRIPEFTSARRTKSGVTLTLKCPQYYHSFELYAVDITDGKREICFVTPTQIDRKGELLSIQIEQEELQSALQKDHRYNWLLVPIGFSESYTETTKSFTWR